MEECQPLKNLAGQLSLRHVHFLGEILEDERVGKWIYASIAFVMPGRLGLSVVHSFAFGTPIISQRKDSFFHGEGVGYVEEGINGFLVTDNNVEEMAKKMELLMTNPSVRERMRIDALLTVEQRCSVEKMVEGFDKAISFVRSQ